MKFRNIIPYLRNKSHLMELSFTLNRRKIIDESLMDLEKILKAHFDGYKRFSLGPSTLIYTSNEIEEQIGTIYITKTNKGFEVHTGGYFIYNVRDGRKPFDLFKKNVECLRVFLGFGEFLSSSYKLKIDVMYKNYSVEIERVTLDTLYEDFEVNLNKF